MDKMKFKEKAPHFCRGKLFYIFLIAGILLTAALGFTVAKYIQTKDVDPNEADAAKFYFTSDVLEEEIAESIKTHYLSFTDLSKAEITFKLYNFQDELNWSGANISYDIECQVDTGARKTVRSDQVLAFNENTKTETAVTLSVQDLGTLQNGSKVTVWANAKAPYSATLVATFVITKPETEPRIVVRDSSGTNEVLVMMDAFSFGSKQKSFQFTYPSKAKAELEGNPNRYCIIDMADDRINDDDKDGIVTFVAYSENPLTFVFYKADPTQVFTESDFVLQK